MQRWRRKVKWLEILNRQRRPVQHSTWIDNDTYRHTIPSCVMLPQLMRVWVPPPWKNPCPAPSDQQTDWLTIPNEPKGKKQKNKILFSSVNKRKRKRVSYRHCQWVKQMIRLKNNPILFAFTVKWGINMWSWGAAERIPPALLCRARHAMCSRRSSYR